MGASCFEIVSLKTLSTPIVYRNEFHKLEKDLHSTKGRDMERYNDIKGQLKESYRQCATVCFILDFARCI